MKKVFLTLAVACMIGLASCGNSVDGKIDKLEKLSEKATELTEKANDGDQDAAKELIDVAAEALKISAELSKEELTPEQQERLKELLTK